MNIDADIYIIKRSLFYLMSFVKLGS
ncbi:hypothetical protein PPL_08870 [Heterostelium album PN500]|uniref:Uncharacterized protein n=1 Tax=Heterostelium pallidum (strain ATCC 26659 / Pp 5 / PN500) TaxID=670386 RepID=D3BJZ0_HETP5|nr:hypothetical protein PPL_08870 [Heterostelium album PN500]